MTAFEPGACVRFLERLDDWIEGRCDPDRDREALDHAGACPSCAAIVAIARETADLPAEPPPDDLVSGVLARTTGPTCERAIEAWIEPCDRTAADLAREHVAGCRACGDLAAAVDRLPIDLARLAEATPPPGFVEGVLARTSARRGRRRAARAWRAMTLRPRFAFEAAYVAVVVITAVGLAFGAAPWSETLGASVRTSTVRSVDGASRAAAGWVGDLADTTRDWSRELTAAIAAPSSEHDRDTVPESGPTAGGTNHEPTR